jgi:S-adenosylmethionine synthetase
MKYKFTSESVSEGHPDKVADQISDAILDAYLAIDKYSKVACETLVTHSEIIVAGEIKSEAILQKKIPSIVRKVLTDIGYNPESGYGPKDFRVHNLLHEQSREINMAVYDGGAGDQGMMFGYACNETPEFMPLAIKLAHNIMERQALLRKNGSLPWLMPDAKSQVTLEYENDKVIGIDTIVVSTQHLALHDGVRITQDFIREQVIKNIIMPVLPVQFRNDPVKYLINPSGSFEIGGPAADTGLTGRKIIVDTYGGSCPHGGGAFSGKDPSKVDRSGAYAARYIAKNLVASSLCVRATVQISYAIGQAEPASIMVNSHGTGRKGITDENIASAIRKIFPIRPKDIIQKFGLLCPIYFPTASYGHMGREYKLIATKRCGSENTGLELFNWEKTDSVEALQLHFGH